jgi:hypothetical protein
MMVIVGTASLLAADTPIVLHQEKTKQVWQKMIAKLRSDDKKDRDEIGQLILQDRQRLVTELQQIVREFIADKKKQEIATAAIILLGKLRAVEAIPILVEHLILPPVALRPTVTAPPSPLKAHPSAGALIEIGSPSLRPLLKKVEVSSDEGTLVLAAIVINGILGPDLAVAAVELRLEQQKDAKVRQRLSKLQERIDKVERFTNWQPEKPSIPFDR